MASKQKPSSVMEQVQIYQLSRSLQVLGVEHMATRKKRALTINIRFKPGSLTHSQMEEYTLSFVHHTRYNLHWISLCDYLNCKVSLQLKNMVSALYSSKLGRTKDFLYNGVKFGWSTVEEMFEREMQRAQSGSLKRVPGLKKSYV